jgi:RHS repeat-associated protein
MIIDNGSTQTVYYPVTDTQGTVYKLLNSSGSVVASYNYDPFGTIIQNTAPTIYMPLGFGATYYDAETGLNFAQQRYYDTTTGRFTTVNLKAYRELNDFHFWCSIMMFIYLIETIF